MARDTAPVSLPLALITVGERLRMVEPATVSNLAVSIQESGWFGSILVRPIAGDEGETRYGLVVGAHRLAAMRQLGRDTIPCTIRTLTDDEAEQLEIDENLVRRGLTPLERAEMVSARFAVWSRRFPDRVIASEADARPKRGRPEKGDNLSQFPEGVPATMGFAADTAAELGLSPKTIKRAWQAVSGLPAELRLQLRGTPVAKNEGLLRQLAALGDKAEQAKVAEILISGRTKNVSEARAYAAGNEPMKAASTPVDETVKAFRKLWGAATPSARAAILHELAGNKKLPAGWAVTEAQS